MLAITEIIESKRLKNRKPDARELRQLPYLHAYVYGRVSSPGQVRDSRESVLEIARLVELAIKDGFQTSLDSEDIKAKLDLLRSNPLAEKMWSDGQVTVDVRDLGISGQLSYEDRLGLAELQRRITEGETGTVYLTEGVSRLSRDRDRIIPYQLLKLMKEHQIRIRTLDGIWNPAIEADYEYLAGQFEEAIGERRVMGRRMFRRKEQKASRGEFVGEPVPVGYILPVTGQKPTGAYEYGKMIPYPPHAEVVNRILGEFVKQGGGYLKTIHALNGLTIPFFPPDLKYMERLSALRQCARTATGYRITFSLIRGLATNIKLTGAWQWGDTEAISDNHPPIVSEELFLEAYRLASSKGKPRGRAANYEPMEWSGLLHCLNHIEPRNIRSLNAKGRYICNKGYFQEGEDVCLDIAGHYLDDPLTATVLGQLDLTPITEEILSRMQSDAENSSLEEVHFKQETSRLEREIGRWQALLPSCVDDLTGQVNREREDYYWAKIKEDQTELEKIRLRSIPASAPPVDYARVREFLKGLAGNWQNYSLTLRNRLLKLIIEKVEIRGQYEIEATIFWKNGFRQRVLIHRPPSNSKLEKRWTEAEDRVLRETFLSSSQEAIMTALPGRSWKGITLRARRLHLARKRAVYREHPWSEEYDEKLAFCYTKDETSVDIASELSQSDVSAADTIHNNTLNSLVSRTTRIRKLRWESSNLIPSQQLTSRGGLRG